MARLNALAKCLPHARFCDDEGTKPRDFDILRFDPFELAPQMHELRKAGVLVKIQEQPLKLLVLLAGRPGELVNRDEIRQSLWGDGTHVDFERSINFCINQVRAAVGDDPHQPRFLETVPRRGYRFIATIEKIAPPPESEGDPNSVAIIQFTNLTAEPEAAWLGWAIAQSVTVDLQKLTQLRVLSSERTLRAVSTLGLDQVAENEILLLRDALPATWVVWGGYQKIGSRIRITAHFSRTATGDLMGSVKADGILEDIFQLEDQIVTGLLEALSISLSSAERLKIEKPETASLQAYEYYVRGHREFNNFGKASLQKAKELFEKALAIHPRYALANSGLGSAYVFSYIGSADPRELEIGIGYLQKAIQEDPELADAYTWLTYGYMRSRRYDDALETGQRAAELDPRSYMVYYFLGSVYMCRAALEYRCGLFLDAAQEFQKSIAAESNYPWSYMNLGWIYMEHGKHDPAEKFLQEAISIQDSASALKVGPRVYGTRTLLGVLAFRQGQVSRAEELYGSALVELEGCDHVYRELLMALAYCGLGDVAFSRARYEVALEKFRGAEQLLAGHPRNLGVGHILIQALLRQCQAYRALQQNELAAKHVARARELMAHRIGFDFGFIWNAWDAQNHYDLAACHALSGKTEEALESLKQAVVCGWRDHQFMSVDVRFGAVRHTPGFRDLVSAVSHDTAAWEPAPPLQTDANLGAQFGSRAGFLTQSSSN